VEEDPEYGHASKSRYNAGDGSWHGK